MPESPSPRMWKPSSCAGEPRDEVESQLLKRERPTPLNQGTCHQSHERCVYHLRHFPDSLTRRYWAPWESLLQLCGVGHCVCVGLWRSGGLVFARLASSTQCSALLSFEKADSWALLRLEALWTPALIASHHQLHVREKLALVWRALHMAWI